MLCESPAGQRAADGSRGGRPTGSPPPVLPHLTPPRRDTVGRAASEGLPGPAGSLKVSDSFCKHKLACIYLEQCEQLIKKPSEHTRTEGSALSNGSGNVLSEQPD